VFKHWTSVSTNKNQQSKFICSLYSSFMLPVSHSESTDYSKSLFKPEQRRSELSRKMISSVPSEAFAIQHFSSERSILFLWSSKLPRPIPQVLKQMSSCSHQVVSVEGFQIATNPRISYLNNIYGALFETSSGIICFIISQGITTKSLFFKFQIQFVR
jgi:hypothetical protein